MPTIDFTEDERAARAAFLREAIAAARFPLSPRLRPIRAVLAKRYPQPAKQPLPLLKPAGAPSMMLQRMRSRRR